MAYKNIYNLPVRRQGEVIGQVFRLITCYNEFFAPRPRVYIKELAKSPNSIYWLQNSKTEEVTTIAIIDKNYSFTSNDIKFHILGHTITKMANQMHNILEHLLGDHHKDNLIYFSKEIFGKAVGICENYGFIPFSVMELQEFFPNIATYSTSYFGIDAGEKICTAMERKEYLAYVRLSVETLEHVEKNMETLFNFIKEKSQQITAEIEIDELSLV